MCVYLYGKRKKIQRDWEREEHIGECQCVEMLTNGD
jgi:hypothetical protein